MLIGILTVKTEEEREMKAPDKLYLGRRSYGPLIGGWQMNPFESKEIESIAYIRKEALLEWINEMREKHRGFTDAELVVSLDKLTEKINSF